MNDLTKVRVPSGEELEGTLVTVDESVERYSDVKLSDGSTLKVKTNVLEAVRLKGKYDDNGNPVYLVKSHNSVLVSEAPQELKRTTN